MINSLPHFFSAYWYYLLGAVVICAVLSYFSKRFFGYMKRGLVVFAIIFVLAAGYELVTGKSIFTLPGSVEKEFLKDTSNTEVEHRYYKSYEERYGEKPPD